MKSALQILFCLFTITLCSGSIVIDGCSNLARRVDGIWRWNLPSYINGYAVTATGATPLPNCTGNYLATGFYNGRVYYSKSGPYYLYYDGGVHYVVCTTLGGHILLPSPSPYWYSQGISGNIINSNYQADETALATNNVGVTSL